MCGIAGILSFKKDSSNDGKQLSQIAKYLEHRGRDGEGIVIGQPFASLRSNHDGLCGNIGLAHRRLAILDLSSAGNQPMQDKDNKAWIVYNGELFNFQELRHRLEAKGYIFTTKTDTEVVLNAFLEWGIDCVRWFEGMFAFAIWDNISQKLYCARDQIGIKPFYYCQTNDSFAFASESKALTPFHRFEINRQALLAYYLGMYVPGPWSIFEGVKKLPPGCVLTISSQDPQAKIFRYWSVGEMATDSSFVPSHENWDELLFDCVKRQLVSDVPVGVFLSGGVDSSAISIMAKKANYPIASFSVGYETQGYDELPYAQAIAQQYSSEHYVLKIDPHTILPSLDRILGKITEPIADSALVSNYLLSEVAAEKGVKVILGGTGGDEVFGGYVRYQDYAWHRYFFNHAPSGMKKIAARIVNGFRPDLAQRMAQSGFDMFLCAGGLPHFVANICRTSDEFAVFLSDLIDTCFPSSQNLKKNGYEAMSFDLQVYLPDELLLLLDQTTMAATVEGRVPLLDTRLIQAAYSLPFAAHVENGQLKTFFKRLVSKYMPDGFFERRKQGFGAPVIHWVKSNFDFLSKTIADPEFDTFPIFFGRPFPISQYNPQRLSMRSANELFRHYSFARWYRSLGGK